MHPYDKKILVAKTTRLLDYALAHKYVMYSKVKENRVTYIKIVRINDPLFGRITPGVDDIRGLTFYTDDTGKVSVSIKWFTPDYTDYTKQ